MFADVAPDARIFQEEIFGPVVAITPFDTDEEALALANGVQVRPRRLRLDQRPASARTTSRRRSRRAWSGSTRNNVRDLRTPFGGVKASGLGHEGGYRSIDFYTDQQAVHITLGEAHNPTFGKGALDVTTPRSTLGGPDARPSPRRPDPAATASRRRRPRRPTSCAARTWSSSSPTSRHRGASTSTCSASSSPRRTTTRLPAHASRSSSTTTSCCAQGPVAAVAALSYRVRTPEDLDKAVAFYEELGCRVERRADGFTKGIGDSVRVEDPLGFPYEFFHDVEHVERLAWRYDLHTPGALVRLDHFNQVTPDVPRAVALHGGPRASA